MTNQVIFISIVIKEARTMTQKPLEPTKVQSLLKSVHKGMEVLDRANKRIGTVKDVYFGADSDEMMQHGAGAATAPDPSMRRDSLIERVARELANVPGDELPEEMRRRLINEGYIQIDTAGILRSDRFILPEQIVRVHDEHVHLNVALDDLLKD
jgi:hypothetical protein